jgi:GNAT superfamily N-acetyltransferase
MGFEVVSLAAGHRREWEQLARGYKTFYQTQIPDAAYERTWNRLISAEGIHGFGAHDNGHLVGITHYLFHTGTWTNKSCYLEDLFVDPACRGRGVARRLIEAVARRAREEGAGRLYWLTHQQNETARLLYDRVASFSGFVEYEYPL